MVMTFCITLIRESVIRSKRTYKPVKVLRSLEHDLANPARLAQITIGRTQRVIEYKYPRGASLGFN
jgi:hypothetical protein